MLEELIPDGQGGVTMPYRPENVSCELRRRAHIHPLLQRVSISWYNIFPVPAPQSEVVSHLLPFTATGSSATFIHFRFPWEHMHDILSSKRMENGIVVFWEEKGEKKNESFNYSELIDMKINALDLLDRPKSYKVDKEAHLVVSQKVPKKP